MNPAAAVVGSPVENYKLYLLGPGGHILAREDLKAQDDAHAIVQAERRSGGGAAELWKGDRKVKAFVASK
jgi:hypothetical protein